jgi:hypothetical protein
MQWAVLALSITVCVGTDDMHARVALPDERERRDEPESGEVELRHGITSAIHLGRDELTRARLARIGTLRDAFE